MPRIRKAWSVKVKWFDDTDIVYAETASKARYKVLLNIRESWPDATLMQISVWRAAAADMTLPDEHRIVADLTPQEREMVSHAFGRDRRGNGYRDHYCTEPGDLKALRLAWVLGLFEGPFGERGYGETPGWAGAFFYLTELGKQVAVSMLPTYV